MKGAYKVEVWNEVAYRVTSYFKDFDGDLSRWKDSFYELWRIQLTWSVAFKIRLLESNADGVFVEMLMGGTHVDNTIESMKWLGYKNITKEEYRVGVVEDYLGEQVIDVMYEW